MSFARYYLSNRVDVLSLLSPKSLCACVSKERGSPFLLTYSLLVYVSLGLPCSYALSFLYLCV